MKMKEYGTNYTYTENTEIKSMYAQQCPDCLVGPFLEISDMRKWTPQNGHRVKFHADIN